MPEVVVWADEKGGEDFLVLRFIALEFHPAGVVAQLIVRYGGGYDRVGVVGMVGNERGTAVGEDLAELVGGMLECCPVFARSVEAYLLVVQAFVAYNFE